MDDTKKHSRLAAVYGFSALCLIAVSAIDSATGPEISLSIFYLIPGVVAAWWLGWRPGATFALVSSASWLLVELNFGRKYTHHYSPYLNGLLQLIMALVVSYLTAKVRERESEVAREAEARKKIEMDLHLERALLDAIESEQQRFGTDIHDGLGQCLVGAGFVASTLKTKLEERGADEAKDAQDLTELITESIGQSRAIARGLYPVKLEVEGLSSALQELADTASARSKVKCRFEMNGTESATPPAIASNLYRIAQEAVNNALKHGAATHIDIRLTRRRSELDLLVTNDGKTFQPDWLNGSGMGLRIMEHRARAVGGKFSIGPGVANGTRIQCTVPLQHEHERREY